MSSSPRVGYQIPKNLGFGWAPSRPNLPEQPHSGEFHFTFDGSGTNPGYIEASGLESEWLVKFFPANSQKPSRLPSWLLDRGSATSRTQRHVATLIPAQLYQGAVLAAVSSQNCLSKTPMPYRGKKDGTLLAVMASHGHEKDKILITPNNKNPKQWYRMCLFKWPKEISLPDFNRGSSVNVTNDLGTRDGGQFSAESV